MSYLPEKQFSFAVMCFSRSQSVRMHACRYINKLYNDIDRSEM